MMIIARRGSPTPPPPLFTSPVLSLRHALSTAPSKDDEDKSAMEKERLRQEMVDQERLVDEMESDKETTQQMQDDEARKYARLLEQVENSKDAEEAVDKILMDDGVTDIDDREMARLKEKYPDDLSDAQLDQLFKDDLKQEDYMGINPDNNKADQSPNYADSDAEDGENPLDDETVSFDEPDIAIPKGDKMSFQAETRQLLDIVTNSIYTDKEVFLRELVSNASDALEKLRHLQTSNKVSSTVDTELPLEVRIDTDEVSSTVTITDTGVGMTREELISNLGTIARSGSRQYVQQLKADSDNLADGSTIIGKFGVGFYSSFMVGRKVEVRSRSATAPDKAHVWSSDGSGEFEIVL
jgi:Histidine kinase-, DNA gyrase B-, and HSP90-like ATPase